MTAEEFARDLGLRAAPILRQGKREGSPYKPKRKSHFEGEGVVADQAGHLVVTDVHADHDAIA